MMSEFTSKTKVTFHCVTPFVGGDIAEKFTLEELGISPNDGDFEGLMNDAYDDWLSNQISTYWEIDEEEYNE